MAGSIDLSHRSDYLGVPKEAKQTKRELNLQLCLSPSCRVLRVFASTVELRTLAHAQALERDRGPRDILNQPFNVQEPLRLLADDLRAVCDAALDQHILPGVGNVIKCEALIRARLHPQCPVNALGSGQLASLLRHLRDFAMYWYHCCQRGRPAVYQIYGHDKCTLCRGKVTLMRYGTMHRITYFCPQCQSMARSKQACTPLANLFQSHVETSSQSSLCSKNSNPAQNVIDANFAAVPAWGCETCTFINNVSLSRCEMCQSERTMVSDHVEKSLTSSGGGVVQQSDTKENFEFRSNEHVTTNGSTDKGCSYDVTSMGCSGTTFEQSKVGLHSIAPSSGSEEETVHAGIERSTLTHSVAISSSSACSATNRASEHSHHRVLGSKKKRSPEEATAILLQPPKCKCPQSKDSVLRRVRKTGPNHQRLFWSCTKVDKGCGLFQWADFRFPKCSSHGRPSTIRRVLKPGSNNGRYFFCCGLGSKQSKCDTFHWADEWGAQLEKKSPHLHSPDLKLVSIPL